MHVCRECGRAIYGPEFKDIFGSSMCAWCYARLMPPYPGPGPDPQLHKARIYVYHYESSAGFA